MLTRDRLDRPVDTGHDHVLGLPDAEITLVEYGSYACPHCRAANESIAAVRDRFGDRLCYVFRQRPLTGSDIASAGASGVVVTLGADFAAARIAVFGASVVAALAGVAILWGAGSAASAAVPEARP